MGDKDKKDKQKLSELEEARLEFVGPIVAAAVTECDLAGEELGELILDATRYALESFEATHTNTPPPPSVDYEEEDEDEGDADEDVEEEEDASDDAFGANLESERGDADEFDIFDADRDA